MQNRLTVTQWPDLRLERIQDQNLQTSLKISMCQERKYHLEEKKRVDLENEAKTKAQMKIKVMSGRLISLEAKRERSQSQAKGTTESMQESHHSGWIV